MVFCRSAYFKCPLDRDIFWAQDAASGVYRNNPALDRDPRYNHPIFSDLETGGIPPRPLHSMGELRRRAQSFHLHPQFIGHRSIYYNYLMLCYLTKVKNNPNI